MLQDLVQERRPFFIFLCETLSKREKVEWVREKLGYVGLHVVECDGHSGGLALLCKKEDTVSVLGSSSNFINVQVTIEQLGTWRFTGFYGHPDRNRRQESWAMLRQLAVSSTLPWCIMRDFNNLLALFEKRGGALKEATSANLLRNQRHNLLN